MYETGSSHRRWWRAVLMGMAIAGVLAQRSLVASHVVSPERTIALRYVVRLPQLPAEAHDVRVWIPLAKTSAEQVVHERTIHAPVPCSVEHEPVYGNDLAHCRLSPPFPASVEIEIDYEASLRGGQAARAVESAPAPAQRERYASAEGLVVIDDEVRTRAALATAGRATLWDRARGIYDAVIARMAYDKEAPGWGRGDTKRACLLGKGNCTDFHSLFISMARAERIPSRFKIGVVIPDAPSGTVAGYHCWAEFYEEDRGWVSVDAAEAWKRPELKDHYFGSWDANRFLISTGRHLDLVPKQQDEPVNIFFYPYVEANGAPLAGAQTQVTFQNHTQEGTT